MRSKRLWLIAVCTSVFVISISASSTSGQTRIKFAKGRTSASLSGVLGAGATRRYVLGARQGQQLSGNVSSHKDCVKFSEASTGVGFTTESGDNRVVVTNYCRSSANYTMTVSITD